MKKIFSSLILLMTVLFAAAQKTIIDDDNAEVRTVNGSFNAIKVSGGIDLYLSQYETESVAVSASDLEARDDIKTEVDNGVLKIYFDGSRLTSWKNRKLRAYVSFKNLELLVASGASDVRVTGTINVPLLRIDCNGASDFKGAIKVNDFSIELGGASDATINGTATNVTIKSSGASDFKGYDLISDYCTANASGACDIHITVNKELNVHASGASDVSYKGDAVIKDLHSSGASSVKKKG